MISDLLTGRPHYGAVLADPPWEFDTYSEKGRGRSPNWIERTPALPLLGVEEEVSEARHYETMRTEDICALDVGQRESPHCVLYLWATFPMLPDAMRVGQAWGFRYCTTRIWAKTRKGGFDPSLTLDQNFPFGTGYVARGNPEPLLIFTRGQPKFRTPVPRALIIAPRREHSRKPDCVRRDIERQVEGPYLEMFARQRAPGWTSWGNQVDRFQGAGT